jgi:hypothetical protein
LKSAEKCQIGQTNAIQVCLNLGVHPKKSHDTRNKPQAAAKYTRPPPRLTWERPPTKSAQIRALWPGIEAALKHGDTLKAVCDCLESDGIRITVHTLGSYIARIRKTSGRSQRPTTRASAAGLSGQTNNAKKVPEHPPSSATYQILSPMFTLESENSRRLNTDPNWLIRTS